MKTFLLDAKRWNWKTKYVISDEYGELCYRVRTKTFFISNHLSFQSADGVEVFSIHKKFWSFRFTHYLKYGDEILATVYRKTAFAKNKFFIETEDGFPYEIKGNFWSSEYVVLRDGLIITEVSKKKFQSEYIVRVDDREDEAYHLAVAVILDRIRMIRKARKRG